MIDFHCHLDLYPNALELLPVVAKRNKFTLAVTTSPRAWQITSQKFRKFENIKVALGLHPEVAERKIAEHGLMISLIPETRYIGEIGIDGSKEYANSLDTQERLFRDILTECNRHGRKILSIHSRNATSRVLDLVERNLSDGVAVMHWFSGSLKEARRAVAIGCWFSVGPAMVRSKKGRDIVHEIPPDRILPETDGPFVTLGENLLMPWDAISIADTLSFVWKVTRNEVQERLRLNLGNLLDEETGL